MATCEICGNEEARYVCSNCGTRAGVLCFLREGWLCKNCSKIETPALSDQGHRDLAIATTLLMIAFLMIFAGVILLAASSTQARGFVLIFPFFFASANGSVSIIIPAAAITIIMIILAFLSLRRSRRLSD